MSPLESISHFVSARFLILCCDVTKAEATCLAVLTRRPTYMGRTLCCDVTKAAGEPGLLKIEMQDSFQVVIARDRTPRDSCIFPVFLLNFLIVTAVTPTNRRKRL